MKKCYTFIRIDPKKGWMKRMLDGDNQGKTRDAAKELAMLLQKRTKRPMGQILLDGGFLSHPDLGMALEEQKRTSELLGQVLIRMGVLDPTDIKAVLSIQEHLGTAEDSVKTAAGVRRMLGSLLVQAGHITTTQLEQAIVEQRKTGEKLGQVLVRKGLLSERQLEGVLDFQRNQGSSKPLPNPLRLGEILVSTGVLTRRNLEDALEKQKQSDKRLGEVLVDAGYVQPHQINYGVRLQQMLLTAVLVALLAACGSGGGSQDVGNALASGATTTTSTVNTDQAKAQSNYLAITLDEYGLKKPNFYYSTNNNSFWSIQANIADNVWDPNFKTVIRIDIPKSNGDMPGIDGKTFSIEDKGQYEKFAGAFVVFNGERSVLKKVESGTISFAQNATGTDEVGGDFDVMLTDYDSTTAPAPKYHIKGTFSFKVGTYGPASPLAAAGVQ